MSGMFIQLNKYVTQKYIHETNKSNCFPITGYTQPNSENWVLSNHPSFTNIWLLILCFTFEANINSINFEKQIKIILCILKRVAPKDYGQTNLNFSESLKGSTHIFSNTWIQWQIFKDVLIFRFTSHIFHF